MNTQTPTTPRAVYRAVALPAHEMWNVTLPDFPTLATVARRIDQVEEAAYQAILQESALDWEPGFQIFVEMANPYQVPIHRDQAIICDIDGTLAIHNSRGPFEFDKVETDDLCLGVFDFLDLFYPKRQVILLSGRQAEYRAHTERWLEKFMVPYDHLYMRAEDDRRSDCLVKAELFDKHVREQYNVTHVLDDRDRVVYLWRKLGLPCWQVAEGKF